MTWLQSLRQPRASIENPAQPLTSQALVDMLVGPKSDAGVSVNERSAFAMPAVYRAVSLISGTVASLPMHAYRDRDDRRERVNSRLIDHPHPDLTPYELIETAFVHILTRGNCYFRKVTNGMGSVQELWPIEPSRVKVGRLEDGPNKGDKVYAIDAKDMLSRPWAPGTSVADDSVMPYTDAEILHIPGMGYDGVCGMSPIAAARQGIGLALAAEKFGGKLFGSGNLMTGILSSDQRLTQEQAEQVKARWKAQHSGVDASHDVAVLGAGMKFQSISVPPEDAQFIESRKFQVTEIARMYGIPPHMLGDTEKSTSWGTGIEQQAIGFVQYTLGPWLRRFEQRLSTLLPQPQYVKFTVEGLLRGDSAARAAFYTSMWNIGALSTNDIRRLEDLPPVEGGDVRYRPLNMGELGEADPAAIEQESADA